MSLQIDTVLLQDPAYLGRVISLLEQNPHRPLELSAPLPKDSAPLQRIGFTGSPGVGKSTLVGAVISALTAKGHRVGVIAVDPTSAFSGGAVLGDRLRLIGPDSSDDVFIRSMASRGSLGGVSPAAGKIAEVMALAGFDRILIETVGVGQLGYDIISLADTVVAMFSPESGDGIQFLKAGMTEFGDVFVVNKCDRPGARLMAQEIKAGVQLDAKGQLASLHHAAEPANSSEASGDAASQLWEPPVLELTARDGLGVDALVSSLEIHRRWLEALPPAHPRQLDRLAKELVFMLSSEMSWLILRNARGVLAKLVKKISSGELSKDKAVQELKAELRDSL